MAESSRDDSEAALADADALHSHQCTRFSGWTQHEIDKLISQEDVPDHWWSAVRIAIDKSSQLYSEAFPKFFSSLRLKSPRHLGNFLRKLKKQSWKATETNNTLLLVLAEVSEVMADAGGGRQISPGCESAGIMIAWLENSTDTFLDVTVTNEMALELHKYKSASKLHGKD